MYKVLPSEFIVSCIPDEHILARKGKYINNPCILKEVTVIDNVPARQFHRHYIQTLLVYPMHYHIYYNIYCKYVHNNHIIIDSVLVNGT